MQLEQRLAVAFGQLVQETAARRVGKRSEQQIEFHSMRINAYSQSCNKVVA